MTVFVVGGGITMIKHNQSGGKFQFYYIELNILKSTLVKDD